MPETTTLPPSVTDDPDRLPPDRSGLLMSVAHIAAATDVPIPSLYKAIRRGDLRSVRLGRRVWVPRQAFEAWLDGEEG